MILDVIQLNKELFSANFAINRDSISVGSVALQGGLGRWDAGINGVFYNTPFEMFQGKTKDIDATPLYRPYVISNNNLIRGSVYQTEFHAGFFNTYEYHQMKRDGVLYELYLIDFKEKGKSPLYCGNRQIAQIEKDAVVYNDLHNYKIFAEDGTSAEIAVLFSLYMYVCGAYKPGIKVTSSVVKEYSRTTNKLLLEKFDPNFTMRIEP